jgi:sugar/nucleoside kinase (ribokinase family)
MAEAGLDTRFVKVSLEHPTLYSFCFTYPDGSGGNLTTDDSACSMIEPAAFAEAFFEFREFRGRGVALAAPEVPLSVRSALLETGRRHDFFTVAAFASEEVLMALEQGMLENVGLLAMNRHEAAALARLPAEASSVRTIVESAMAVLVPRYPGLLVSITAGVQGSWIWEGNRLTHRTALEVNVAGASGAGDAHLAGLIVGLAAGLTLAQAHELAILLACFSVTSPHTIHPGATRRALREFAQQAGAPLSPPLEEFLKDHEDH